MTKLGSGVTLMEASQTLGYYAVPLQLSKLMYHPNINKWSKCKPIKYTGPSPETLADWEQKADDLHWGFEFKSVGPMNTDGEMYGSAITLSKGDCWIYSGYTASNDYPARLGSFRGYNTDAECPYLPLDLTYNDTGVEGSDRNAHFELTFRTNQSQSVEINPYNYSNLHGNYHILVRRNNQTTGSSIAQTAVTENFTGFSSSRIEIPTGSTGVYEACAAIRRGGGEQEIYPLPNTFMTFEVRNQTQEEYVGLSLVNQCSMTLSSTIGHLTVKLQLRNLTDSSITALVGCYVYDNRNQVLFQCFNHSVTVPAMSMIVLYGDDNNSLSTTDTGPIRIENVSATGDFRPPIYSECRAKNSTKGDVEMKKTATILN